MGDGKVNRVRGTREKQRTLSDHRGETAWGTEKAWASPLSRLAEVMGKDQVHHLYARQEAVQTDLCWQARPNKRVQELGSADRPRGQGQDKGSLKVLLV